MKRMSFTIVVGVFFLLMQFSGVAIYSQMLSISKNQGLPMEQLIRLQGVIMGIVLLFMVICGILFAALLVGQIRGVFKQHESA